MDQAPSKAKRCWRRAGGRRPLHRRGQLALALVLGLAPAASAPPLLAQGTRGGDTIPAQLTRVVEQLGCLAKSAEIKDEAARRAKCDAAGAGPPGPTGQQTAQPAPAPPTIPRGDSGNPVATTILDQLAAAYSDALRKAGTGTMQGVLPTASRPVPRLGQFAGKGGEAEFVRDLQRWQAEHQALFATKQ